MTKAKANFGMATTMWHLQVQLQHLGICWKLYPLSTKSAERISLALSRVATSLHVTVGAILQYNSGRLLTIAYIDFGDIKINPTGITSEET